MRRPCRGSVLLAAALFFLSGALGLGYQLVWIRKATLVVGASQIALSTVLTSFFIGLALGSLVVGKHWRSRRFSPLFVYGLFEACIGLYALAFPLLFECSESVYASLYGVAADSTAALFLLRFGLLFALFLLPTFFMGGTLPLLLDGLVGRDAAVGSLTSVLYGLNIAGAVLGVLLTGYFAIPSLGMNGTSMAAGVGNLAIAALALLAFRRTPPLHLPAAAGAGEPGPGAFFCTLALLSGFAAIGYQVAWARYFSLFKTSSVYLTAILLAVFLAALALGSMAMARVLATGVRPLRVVALVQPIAALLVLYSLDWWSLADYGLAGTGFQVEPSWYFASEAADYTFFAPLFQVGLVIFIPVLLLGTGLPGLIAASTRNSAELRRSSGRLVFWNTVGASAGGFAAGYLLIPSFGLAGALFVLTLITLILGAAAETRLGSQAGRRRWIPGWGHGLCALALAAGIYFLRGDLSRRVVSTEGVGRQVEDARLVDLIEGPLTTASVFAGPKNRYIAAGNQILAVVRQGELPVQVIEGHLPALFYPRPGTPQRVLGIAIGSGQSFGALLRYPVEHMDVVDISAEMIAMALDHFGEFNAGLGDDPRVSIHLDDGRHFVERAAPGSYDVVSMEPPPPTAEGVHPLYSLEFYRAVDRVLRQDGVLMQWVPLYHLTPNETLSLVKTQAAVFPHTFIVRMGLVDFVALSFKGAEPPRFSTAWIAERARVLAREPHLTSRRWTRECRYETASLEGILALITTGPEDIARLQAPYIYRDDDQRLSYSSGDRRLLRRYRGGRLAEISFAVLPRTPFGALQRYFLEPLDAAELDEERARALSRYHVPSPAALAAAEEQYRRSRLTASRAESALGVAQLQGPDFAASLAYLRRAIDADPHYGSAGSAWIDKWADYHAQLRAPELQNWIDELPLLGRGSPLVRSVEAALERYRDEERERRAAYLW